MSKSEQRAFVLTIAGVVLGGIALAFVRRQSPMVRSLIGE